MTTTNELFANKGTSFFTASERRYVMRGILEILQHLHETNATPTAKHEKIRLSSVAIHVHPSTSTTKMVVTKYVLTDIMETKSVTLASPATKHALNALDLLGLNALNVTRV